MPKDRGGNGSDGRRVTSKRVTDKRADGRVTEVGMAGGPQSTRPIVPGLYVVATPLGHLDDLGIRARRVLGQVERIYAEDTRVTATLLAHAGVTTRARSMHAHNEVQRTEEILAELAAGAAVALVSDAGTPAISDPGARVVRAALHAGYRVVPIPGPSAVAAAVSAAGLVAERFLFLGFLPTRRKALSECLGEVAQLPVALVIYEAPHRVRATLATLERELGPARTLVVARELTKAFEEIARMPLGEASAWIDANPHRERGEFVLVIDAPEASAQAKGAAPDLSAEGSRWLDALCAELPPAQAARIAAAATGIAREQVYAEALARKGSRGGAT